MAVKYLKSAEEIPGSYGLPYFGEAIELFKEQQCFHLRRFNRYGSVYKTKIFNTKIACFVSPEANQRILKDESHKFSSRQPGKFIEPLLGNGIIFQDGVKHERSRKIMYPAFHPRAIAVYFEIVRNTVENFLAKWQHKRNIFLFNDLRQCNLILGCQLFFGTQAESEIEKLNQWFSELVEGIRTVVRWDIPLTKFGRARIARGKIEEFLSSIIAKRRKENNSEKSEDVLSLLINSTDEEGDLLSDSEIINEAIGLLYLAHENIAKMLCWCLFELARNPDWLSKLRQEQSKTIGKDRLQVLHLKNLTKMEWFLKEVERIYPSLYTIPRAVVENFECEGYVIPKGWFVIVSPLLTHRSPLIYKNPDKFDPLRFAPPRQEDKKHPFALIGFGGGIHQCLGFELAQMEIKIILSTILKHYNWEISPKYRKIAPALQATKKIEEQMTIDIFPHSLM